MTNEPDEFLSSVSDSGSYDANGFYVASRNKKGFTKTLYLGITPEIAASLGELVAMRQFPLYRTPGDIHRNGLVHILHRDKELAKEQGKDPAYARESQYLLDSLILQSEMEKIKIIIDAEEAAAEQLSDFSRKRLSDSTLTKLQPHVQTVVNHMADPVNRDLVRRMWDVPT